MLSASEELEDQVVLAFVVGRTTVGTHETRFSSITSDHQKYCRISKFETLATFSTATLPSSPLIRDKDDEFFSVTRVRTRGFSSRVGKSRYGHFNGSGLHFPDHDAKNNVREGNFEPASWWTEKTVLLLNVPHRVEYPDDIQCRFFCLAGAGPTCHPSLGP